MVHASDGDPGVYLPLAESLNNTVWGLTVTDASKLTDLDTLLSLHLSSIKQHNRLALIFLLVGHMVLLLPVTLQNNSRNKIIPYY